MKSNRKITKSTMVSVLLLMGLILSACQSAGSAKDNGATPPVSGYGAATTPAAQSAGSGVEIKVSSNDSLGKFLVDGKGMTLYLYTKDSPGVSVCKDGCLDAWPALITDGDPQTGEGVTGKLGTITRDDGTKQVTYNDAPLYYYASDTKPGDTTGQGVGSVWYVVAP